MSTNSVKILCEGFNRSSNCIVWGLYRNGVRIAASQVDPISLRDYAKRECARLGIDSYYEEGQVKVSRISYERKLFEVKINL